MHDAMTDAQRMHDAMTDAQRTHDATTGTQRMQQWAQQRTHDRHKTAMRQVQVGHMTGTTMDAQWV